MGMGRLALSPPRPAIHRALQHPRRRAHPPSRAAGPERWKTETIYLGPQGPRGIAAGRFSENPVVETVAIFGYSGKVELLSRKGSEKWQVETSSATPTRGTG